MIQWIVIREDWPKETGKQLALLDIQLKKEGIGLDFDPNTIA